jgi:hypothetical protein
VNAKFAQTLVVVSMGAFAIAANAQNNTPRDNPAGTNTFNTTQQGTQTGTTNSTAPSGSMGMQKYRSLSDSDMHNYKTGWAACDKTAGADQTTCRTKFASTWSQVDPKCQKVSGSALDDCLKGADHGQ